MDHEKGARYLSDMAGERLLSDATHGAFALDSERKGDYTVERLSVGADDGKRIGREAGRYITLTAGTPFGSHDGSMRKAGRHILAKELTQLFSPHYTRGARVLAVGLGNSSRTTDALGVLTCEKLRQTAVIKKEDRSLFFRLGCAELVALTPDVEAKTGISTETLVRAVTKELRPALVVAIDALCTKNFYRLGASVQLTDTGIYPGSGVGASAGRISESTVSVPVIAIGAPTVQSAHAYLIEEGSNRDMRDFSSPAATAFVTRATLRPDIEACAELIAGAIHDALGVRDPD